MFITKRIEFPKLCIDAPRIALQHGVIYFTLGANVELLRMLIYKIVQKILIFVINFDFVTQLSSMCSNATLAPRLK